MADDRLAFRVPAKAQLNGLNYSMVYRSPALGYSKNSVLFQMTIDEPIGFFGGRSLVSSSGNKNMRFSALLVHLK
jgi:hypothetical protein